jgi:hypothetical protein
VGIRVVSIDQMRFGSAHLKERRYEAPVAVVCGCGKATLDHTLQERRLCRQEAA